MKVFLDIGAHRGQSIEAALHPKYGFERIVAFEPVRENADHVRSLHTDPRVEVLALGVWNQTTEARIYMPGSTGASLFQDKNNAREYEVCQMVRASEWFAANLGPDDRVVIKINAEGAECDIVDDLIDANLLDRIEFLFLAFDVDKIPSQARRSAELRARLQQLRFNRYFAWDGFFAPRPLGRLEFILRGRNHTQFLRHWLDAFGIADQAGLRGGVRSRLFEAREAFDRGSKMVEGAVRRRIPALIGRHAR